MTSTFSTRVVIEVSSLDDNMETTTLCRLSILKHTAGGFGDISSLLKASVHGKTKVSGKQKDKWVCGSSVREAACPCARAIDRSSHVGYRSLLTRTPIAYTRPGQSECRIPPAPIRTPERSSRLGGQMRILGTHSRASRLNPNARLYFPYFSSPPH